MLKQGVLRIVDYDVEEKQLQLQSANWAEWDSFYEKEASREMIKYV